MSFLKLEQICSAIVDCEHKTAPIDETGDFFAVGTPAMRGNQINYSEARRISESTFQAWTKRLQPRKGDLLFAREAPVGPVVQIPDSENVAPGQRTVLLRISSEIADSQYMFYALSSPVMQRRILSLAAGSTVPHLNVSDIRNLQFELPDLLTQRAIAEGLGALDDKIAANSMKASTAEQLAGVLFDKVSVDLNKIPVSQVLTPILGGTPNRKNPEFWGGQVHWASAKDVTSAPHSVVADTEEKITRMATEQTKAKPLPIGGVIVTARGTVGAVARLALPTSFNQSCYGFSPSELPPGLLYFSILRAAQRAKSLSHGSVFDTITMKTFDHLFIPDFGESAEKMEHQIAPLLETVDSSIKENKTLVSMRDALLPQLMSGKLRVRDAEAVVEDVL